MSAVSALLKTGTITTSLGVYLPSVVLQKVLGLGRVLLLTHLLLRDEYGVWGLGVMLFNLASQVLTLGSNEGVVRYVSFYEARGGLKRFCRRLAIFLPLLGVALAAAGWAAESLLAGSLFASSSGLAAAAARRLLVVRLGLANALALALYQNLLSLLVGLRVYRLLAAVELLFNVLFTAGALVVAAVRPSAEAVLWAHLAALGATMAAGLLGARAAVRAAAAHPPVRGPEDEPDVLLEPEGDAGGMQRFELISRDRREGSVFRVLRFGLLSMPSNLLWQLSGFASVYLVNRWCGRGSGGVYFAFWQVAAPLLAMGNAAWGVVFAHVARRWEHGDRETALLVLSLSYKAIALGLGSVAVLVDAAAPLWTLLVGRDYRAGSQLLPGLLAMFLAASLPAIMTIHAKLRERPYMVALLAAAGVAATVGVGRWIVPAYGEVGMAYAAGAGMTLAAIVVSWAYFRLADSTWLRPASWIWLGLPVLLMLAGALGRLLGGPVAGLVLLAAWTVLLAAVVRSRRVFSRYERQLLATAAGGLLQRIRRLGRRR